MTRFPLTCLLFAFLLLSVLPKLSQSYPLNFNVHAYVPPVDCVSGPNGIYRSDVLRAAIESAAEVVNNEILFRENDFDFMSRLSLFLNTSTNSTPPPSSLEMPVSFIDFSANGTSDECWTGDPLIATTAFNETQEICSRVLVKDPICLTQMNICPVCYGSVFSPMSRQTFDSIQSLYADMLQPNCDFFNQGASAYLCVLYQQIFVRDVLGFANMNQYPPNVRYLVPYKTIEMPVRPARQIGRSMADSIFALGVREMVIVTDTGFKDESHPLWDELTFAQKEEFSNQFTLMINDAFPIVFTRDKDHLWNGDWYSNETLSSILSGLLFPRPIEFTFARIRDYYKAMNRRLGIGNWIDTEIYRLAYDAILTYGYGLANFVFAFTEKQNKDTPPELKWLLLPTQTFTTDFVGTTGRVRFEKAKVSPSDVNFTGWGNYDPNWGRRVTNQVEIEIINVNYVDKLASAIAGSPLVTMARWSDANFRWEYPEYDFLYRCFGGAALKELSPYLSFDRADLPARPDRWSFAPTSGAPPEFAYGYCSALVTVEPGIEEYAVYYGGESSSIKMYASDRLYVIHLNSGRWSERVAKQREEEIRPGSTFHSCVAIGKKFYVFGGKDWAGSLYNELWEFDIGSMRWRSMTSLNAPASRVGAGLVVWKDGHGNEDLVLFGGRGEEGLLNDMHRCRISGSVADWESVQYDSYFAADLPLARVLFNFNAVENEDGSKTLGVIGFGGRTTIVDADCVSWGCPPRLGPHVWFFTMPSSSGIGHWTRLTEYGNPPSRRFAAGGAVLDSKFYLLHGVHYVADNSVDVGYVSDAFVGQLSSNFTSITWSRLDDYPSNYTFPGRGFMQPVVYDSHLILYGGLDVVDTKDLNVINTLAFQTNPDSAGDDVRQIGGSLELIGRRRVHASMITPKSLAGHSAYMSSKYFAVFGGYGNRRTMSNSVYVFSPSDQQWLVEAPPYDPSNAPEPRAFHCGVLVGYLMYAYGGIGEDGTVFDDLWRFTSVQSDSNPDAWFAKWEKIEIDESEDAFPPAYGHSCLRIDENVILFVGGKSASGMRDVPNDQAFLLNLETRDWRVVSINATEDGRKPQGLAYCSITTLHYEFKGSSNWIVLEGCESPVAVLGDIWMFSLDHDPVRWHAFPVPPQFRSSRHDLVTVSSRDWGRFGGYIGPDAVSDLWVGVHWNGLGFDFFYLQPETELVKPLPRQLHRCLSFKQEIYCIGGLVASVAGSVTFDSGQGGNMVYSVGVVVPRGATVEVWKFHFETICDPDVIQAARRSSGLCLPCSPGTVYDDGRCRICPRGQYSMGAAAKNCSDCPAGYFGAFDAASTELMCLPCPPGTYQNETGSSTCNKCSSDHYCPLGSISGDRKQSDQPLLSSSYTTEPKYFDDSDTDSSHLLIVTYSVLPLIAGAIMVILLVLWCADIIRPSTFMKLDCLFSDKHDGIDNDRGDMFPSIVVEKKTVCGAIFSAVAFALVLASFFANLSIYFLHWSDTENLALLPSNPFDREITSEMFFTLELPDYKSRCLKNNKHAFSPALHQACDEGIKITPSNLASLTNADELVCWEVMNADGTSNCHIQWKCPSCALISAAEGTASVQFGIETTGAFAQHYRYTLETSTGYYGSKYIDEPKYRAVTGGVVIPSDESVVFRGFLPPSKVFLTLIPTNYTWSLSLDRDFGQGFHLQFDSSSKGREVDSTSFFTDNGFAFVFDLSLSSFTLNIFRTNEHSFFTIVPTLLGNAVGLLGGIGIGLKIAEIIAGLLKFPIDYEDWENVGSWSDFFRKLKKWFQDCTEKRRKKKKDRKHQQLRASLIDRADQESSDDDRGFQLRINDGDEDDDGERVDAQNALVRSMVGETVLSILAGE